MSVRVFGWEDYPRLLVVSPMSSQSSSLTRIGRRLRVKDCSVITEAEVRVRETLEDATLLALVMEEKAMSQGM